MKLDEFAEYLNRRVSKNTASTYVSALQQWFRWMDGSVPTKENAQAFLDHLEQLGKSPNTISIKANAIRRYFKWLGTPITLDCSGAVIREPEYLNQESLEKVIAACKTPLEPVSYTHLTLPTKRIV